MADLQTDTIYVVELVVTPTVLIRGKFLSLLIKKRIFFFLYAAIIGIWKSI